MSLWSLVKPPRFVRSCHSTIRGWVANNKLQELLIAIPNLITRQQQQLDVILSQVSLEDSSGFVLMEQTLESEGYIPNYIILE